MSLRDRRVQYESARLDRADLSADPVTQWHLWYQQATSVELDEPNAFALATVDASGHPDVRILLARGVDAAGIEFYTNRESPKAHQIRANPEGAAVFSWLGLHRQVRVRGGIELLSDEQSDNYFASRPREHQLGAWASPQSQAVADRAVLEARLAEASRRFEGHRHVPRPPFWGGFRLVPAVWEFWQGRPHRLHDRFRYQRDAHAGGWSIDRLAP